MPVISVRVNTIINPKPINPPTSRTQQPTTPPSPIVCLHRLLPIRPTKLICPTPISTLPIPGRVNLQGLRLFVIWKLSTPRKQQNVALPSLTRWPPLTQVLGDLVPNGTTLSILVICIYPLQKHLHPIVPRKSHPLKRLMVLRALAPHYPCMPFSRGVARGIPTNRFPTNGWLSPNSLPPPLQQLVTLRLGTLFDNPRSTSLRRQARTTNVPWQPLINPLTLLPLGTPSRVRPNNKILLI